MEKPLKDRELVELIDFSPSLDFRAKKRWRSYVPYLNGDLRDRLAQFLQDEKRQVTEILRAKMKGVRGYFFAKNLESIEKSFLEQMTK